MHNTVKKYLLNFKKFNEFNLIGMGGSILGSEAIYDFLKKKIKKKVYFFNNLDEDKILNFKKKKNLSEILFIIISKSGNTVETLANIFSLGIIKKYAKNVILISEKNNFLHNLSKNLNLFHIEHKYYIGGRYSVLSEVGMLPAMLMGLKIDKFRHSTKRQVGFNVEGNKALIKKLINNLSFQLTNSQLNALYEILDDIESGAKMNRLLQGDVGSGKTIVALISALHVINSGYQVAFLVPTEILAIQHYNFVKKKFKQLNINVFLLTASIDNKILFYNNCKVTFFYCFFWFINIHFDFV